MDGHSKSIWEEIEILQKKRNTVVHQGKLAVLEDVTLAMQVGGFVLGMFLPSVLKGFGLKLNNEMLITDA
jgi:hypothetical protein